MKAILEFNLPEDTSEHYTAIHANDFRSALVQIEEYLRRERKNGSGVMNTESVTTFFYDAIEGLDLYK